MISFLCFIVPIILWVLTFPIKMAIKSLELSLKLKEVKDKRRAKKENGENRSLLTRLEDWADTDDNDFELEKKIARKSGNIAKGTGKFVLSTPYKVAKAVKSSRRAIKVTKKVVKGTVKITRQAIKLTIRTLKLIIALIRTIISALLACGIVGIIILVIIVVALIVCVVVIILNSSITEGKVISSNAQGNNSGGGVAYLSIDWSQDFSAKLQEIEGTYGAKNRHHAELVILNCRTLQSNPDIVLDASTWVGIKKIETGTDVFKNSNSSYSVFDSYADIYTGNNGSNCYGAYQINMRDSAHAWTLYNKDYQATKGSPYGGSRDSTYGNIFFYPDLCLGTNKAYSKSITSWSTNSGANRGYAGILDDLKQCFADLGVEYSDERGKKVLEFFLANSYNVGSVKSLKGTTYNAIAKLYIQFFNTYGWNRNDAQIEMIKSTVNAGKENTNIYVPTDVRDWVWGGSASNFDSSISCGLLDANGKAINKTIYGYLSDGNPSLKSAISSKFPGNSGINEAQLYYGIAVYFVGTWEIEKTIDYLGIRDQMTDYSSGGDSGGNGDVGGLGAITEQGVDISKLSAKRQKYLAEGCALLGTPYQYGGTKVPSKGSDGKYDVKTGGLDCSAFVQHCLSVVGVNTGRSTYAQASDTKNFKEISLKDAKPGDVYQPHTGHTTFFIKDNGDGSIQALHEPQTGDVCKIGRYPIKSGGKFYRVLGVD